MLILYLEFLDNFLPMLVSSDINHEGFGVRGSQVLLLLEVYLLNSEKRKMIFVTEC